MHAPDNAALDKPAFLVKMPLFYPRLRTMNLTPLLPLRHGLRALSLLLLLHAGTSALAQPDAASVQALVAQAPRTHYSAGDPGLRLYQRYDSENDSRAEWRGKVTLSGKLLVLFNGGQRARASESDGFLVFVPDRRSREHKLPAALDRFACPALWIWVNNDADQTLVSLLGQAGKDRIKRTRGNRFEIDVTLQTQALQSMLLLQNGNGRAYLIEHAQISARNPKVTVNSTPTQAPAQDLPFCK